MTREGVNSRAKTINLLLYGGDLQGVISVEDSGWNSGELYSAPRDSVEDLLATDACKKYGIYLLLSEERVYVGQSSDLSRRLTQHIIGKDWWESAVILTTKDNSLNHTDIDYLESMLIEKAFSKGRLDCDNKNKGADPKVDRFREVYLSQYLEEALFLMELIGITVFSDEPPRYYSDQSSDGTPVIRTIDRRTRLAIGTRAKREAVAFLTENGVELGEHVNYSVLQENGTDFWINPKTDTLTHDWNLILNDTSTHELIVLSIPAGTFEMGQDEGPGLLPRSDKPELIDILISREGLIDRRSGIDFSPYLLIRLPY